MPRVNAFVELNIPEASHLADYTGIRHDLDTAKRFIQLSYIHYPSEALGGGITEALTTAILIRYCRSFGGLRIRSWNEHAMNCLSEEQRALHQHIWEIRSKHIAHSVNNYEENRPHARYWTDTVHDQGFESIGCNQIRVISLGGTELAGLTEIIDILLAAVRQKISEEEVRILEIVRRMPVEEVLSFGHRPPADLSNPQRSRERPRR